MEGFRIHADYQAHRPGFAIYLFERHKDGSQSVCTGVAMAKADTALYMDPAAHLTKEAAQELLDDLWRSGIRPSVGVSSSGQLEAMQSHITDLRKLAFKAYKVND